MTGFEEIAKSYNFWHGFFKSHQMAINMWSWHEFHNWNLSQHLSKSFCSNTCFVKKSSLGKNLCYSIFFLSFILTKSFLRDLLLVIVFKRMSYWLQTLNTRDQRSLGSLQEAGFASWLITGHKRPTSFGFIARSGYNFLVVVTGHKGPMFLGVHCKKWE